MEWPRLVGAKRKKPSTGTWQDWKQHIADDCGARCVYCAINEGRFGGIRNFHVEHYRPKSRFPQLENDICNLYLACAVCNVLKCDDWPGEPCDDHRSPAYPDPAKCDYNKLFTVDSRTYEVASTTIAGQYVAERLMLNRGQLILQRRLDVCLRRLAQFELWCHDLLAKGSKTDLREAFRVLLAVSSMKAQVISARPYDDVATKRTAKRKARAKPKAGGTR